MKSMIQRKLFCMIHEKNSWKDFVLTPFYKNVSNEGIVL